MLSKFEFIGISLSVLFMALALYLIRLESSVISLQKTDTQLAGAVSSGVVVVDENNSTREAALIEAADSNGNIKKLVIDDIKIGSGSEVKTGDTVSVHYVGRLQSGTEFDNSKKRGEPFVFTVGEGRVIKGWDEGLVGMKVGGERILVIPPEKAYGENGIGPIPPNATLIFSIELVEIK